MSQGNQIHTAMIFAAGLGTRMRPLTDNLPKPLIEVAGVSMLRRIIDGLKVAGIKRCVVNVHYLPEKVIEHVKDIPGIIVDISDESEELLDTGGGVVKALSLLQDETFFVINGDVVLPQIESALKQMQNAWNPNDMDLLMLLHNKNEAIGYDGKGDFNLSQDGKILREESGENQYAFTGIQILKSKLINKIDKKVFSLREVYFSNIGDDTNYNICGIINNGDWLHVGTPENLEEAEKYYDGRSATS